MRKTAVIVFLTLFLLTFVSPTFANKRSSRILGASTSNLQMPPTAEGPGLLLPDSPFYFLDNLKQNTRLFLAFTPEQRAKIHSDIAGERLAELRFMLAKNNKNGIRTALQGVSDNLQNAANDVGQAQLSGRDVSKLAKDINDKIKAKQQTLDILDSQAVGEIKALVKATDESLMGAKIKTENALSQDELQKEIQNDLNRDIEKEIQDASDSADELKDDLDELNKEASDAAKNSLKRREDALKKAIEGKNEVLKKLEERRLEIEKKKQEKILELNKDAAEQIRQVVEKAQKAANTIQTVQQRTGEIKNQPED